MKVYCLQNHPLAGLGAIETWINNKGYSVNCTKVYKDTNFLPPDNYDLLIILGGPMGAYEEEKYPWLKQEKDYIIEAIARKKLVLGICLGAQLIASALGSSVYPHSVKEIGWWQLERTKEYGFNSIVNGFPSEFTVFQYHNDTFDLPQGAVRLAESKACLNQAFLYEDHVIGLQFHPEMTEIMINNIVEADKNKFESGSYDGPFIQKPEDFLQRDDFLKDAHSILFNLLENIENVYREGGSLNGTHARKV